MKYSLILLLGFIFSSCTTTHMIKYKEPKYPVQILSEFPKEPHDTLGIISTQRSGYWTKVIETLQKKAERVGGDALVLKNDLDLPRQGNTGITTFGGLFFCNINFKDLYAYVIKRH